MGHGYSKRQEYSERQEEIDKTLTPQIIHEICLEYDQEISLHMNEEKERFIVITYASTHALLRRIKGDKTEKPLKISYSDINKARKMLPNSKVVKEWDPSISVVILICSLIPATLIGQEKDLVLTHTTTCFKI